MEDKTVYDKLGMDESNFMPVSIRALLKATPDVKGYEDDFYLRLFPIADRIPLYNNYIANQWARGYVPEAHFRLLNSKTCTSISKKLVSKIVGNIKIKGEADNEIDLINDAIINFKEQIYAAETHCLDRGESIITADVIGEETERKVILNVYPLFRYQLKQAANGEIYDALLFKQLTREQNTDFVNYLICEHRFYKVRDGVKVPFVENIVVQNTWNSNSDMWSERNKVNSIRLKEDQLPKLIRDALGDTKINKPKEVPMFGVYRLKNTTINKLAPYSDVGESQFIDAVGWMMAVETAMTYREMDKNIGRGRVMVPMTSNNNGLGAVNRRNGESLLDYSFMTPFKSNAASLDSKTPIEPVQFALRDGEWNSSVSYAEAKVCVRCGLSVLDYDPTISTAQIRTATEINYLVDITANTVKEKRALIQSPLNHLVQDIATLLGYTATVFVEFDPSTILNATQQQSMVTAQFGAGLMSRETALKALHPDWEPEEIQAELSRIDKERDNAAAVGAFNNTFGLGA